MAEDTTHKERREKRGGGEGGRGGEKRDKSIESSLKVTGAAAAAAAAGLALKRHAKLISADWGVWGGGEGGGWGVAVRSSESKVRIFAVASVVLRECGEVRVHTRAQTRVGAGQREWGFGGVRVRAEGRVRGEHCSTGGEAAGTTRGGDGKRKKRKTKTEREIQGEALLSLTTQMEVSQGHTVGHLLDRSELRFLSLHYSAGFSSLSGHFRKSTNHSLNPGCGKKSPRCWKKKPS